MFTLLAGKFIGIIGLVAAVGVALHIGVGTLTSYVAELEVTKIAYEQQSILLEEKDAKLHRLSETHTKMEQEVNWARDYVQKQNATIEKLREEASIEVQDCLDMNIDSRFTY